MAIYKVILSVFMFTSLCCAAQEIELLKSGTQASLRGISTGGNSIWVSGSNGTVGRSVNNGRTWQWITVKGYEKTDFRDIEAFDAQTAIAMGIASPAYILKTTDGGHTWKRVFYHADSAMFLDAMTFRNKKEGIVIGDPINNKIFVAATKDGGNTWKETGRLGLPRTKNGEAFFAASGTNIVWKGDDWWLVSGGMASRVFSKRGTAILPIMQGQQMTGPNSVDVYGKTILIAGGDYEEPGRTDSAFVISRDGGNSWEWPATTPGGYKSCVCFISSAVAVTCGLTGVAVTYDGGNNWKEISKEGFNTCAYNKKSKTVFFAGSKGKLGILVLNK